MKCEIFLVHVLHFHFDFSFDDCLTLTQNIPSCTYYNIFLELISNKVAFLYIILFIRHMLNVILLLNTCVSGSINTCLLYNSKIKSCQFIINAHAM